MYRPEAVWGMVEDGVITKNSPATINQASFQTYDTERKNQARALAKGQNGSAAASGGGGGGGGRGNRGGVEAPASWGEDKAVHTPVDDDYASNLPTRALSPMTKMEVQPIDEDDGQRGANSLSTASLFFGRLSPEAKVLAVRLAEMSDVASRAGRSLVGTGPYCNTNPFRKQIKSVSNAVAKGARIDGGDDHLIDFMNGNRADKPAVIPGEGSGSGSEVGAGSGRVNGGGSASDGTAAAAAAAGGPDVDPDDDDFE